MKYFNLVPQDTIVTRDGRFNGDSEMYSSAWILPSVMAGSVRTVIGKTQNENARVIKWNHNELRKIAVAGPFPFTRDQSLCFFPPADLVPLKVGNAEIKIFPLKPSAYAAECGSDLPDGLLPCALPDKAPQGKPVAVSGFWNLNRMKNWLLGREDASVYCSPNEIQDLPMPREERSFGIKIKPETKTVEDGKLFTCSGLSFGNYKASLSIRIDDSNNMPEKCVHPVGGERHLVHWSQIDGVPDGWECPQAIANRLNNDVRKIRMVLASPAIFKNGWLPDWLDESLSGKIPGTQVIVKLKSAAVPRWKAISGWSYEIKGPKPIRRMVPAGSVYFFEIQEGSAQDLPARWMQSVSDESLDGFGLALWGLWI